MTTTVHRQCTLCEAHCGIKVESEGTKVLRITGDPDDVMSKGYICPKAAALADLHHDPDRLRRPVKRVGDEFVEIGWDEALELASSGLRRIIDRDGRDGVATYLGNPGAHSSAALAFFAIRALLRSANNYSASSTDQLPQHRTSHEMFGTLAILPIPDIDRTDHMLVLGANPAVSNGSVMTAPGARHRLRAIVERGGHVVVVDPRRTETVAHASEHVQVRPGGDPFLLLGMLHTIVDDGLVDLGAVAGMTDGLDELEALVRPWTPERAAPLAGVDAPTIARLARDFAAAPSAVAYGRVGVCQQRTGTVTHWLINALNVVTGNFDRAGGMMTSTPAIDGLGPLGLLPVTRKWGHRQPARERPGRLRRRVPGRRLRRRDPHAGEGAGPRASSATRATRCSPRPTAGGSTRRSATLEHYVAVDMYITETTRHAHVILPPVSHLERSDVDFVFPAVSVHNHIRPNPAAVPAPPDGRTDWEILWALAGRLGGGLAGRIQNGLVSLVGAVATPDRVGDLALRAGPYGLLARGPRGSLTMGKVKESVHGIDLGPLQPRLAGADANAEEAPAADDARAARGRGGARGPRRRAGGRRGVRLRPHADRPPSAAVEQLMDAQQPAADEGRGPLHRAPAPGRRAGARDRRG